MMWASAAMTARVEELNKTEANREQKGRGNERAGKRVGKMLILTDQAFASANQ